MTPIIPRIRCLLYGKASQVVGAVLGYSGTGAQSRPRNYESFAKEGYQQSAECYSAIHLIVTTCKGIPLKVYQRGVASDPTPNEVTKGLLVDLLASPNPNQGGAALAEGTIASLLISGNAYLERVGVKEPKELYVLRSDRVSVLTGDRLNPIKGYEYRASGEPIPLLMEDVDGRKVQKVLHLKLYHPLNDWYGMSPMEAAARSIDQVNAGHDWNTVLLQNYGKPSGTYSTDATLDSETFEAARAEIQRHHSGPANAGRALVTSGGFRFLKESMSPAEMDWLEGMDAASLRIWSVYGVPPELLGDSKHRTFSNFFEARRFFYTETALPLLNYVCGELTRWLAPFFGDDLYIAYDKNAIDALQEERSLVWDRTTKAAGGVIMTPNEARKELGLDPHPAPEANMLHFPSTSIPAAPPEALPPSGNGVDKAAAKVLQAIHRRFPEPPGNLHV